MEHLSIQATKKIKDILMEIIPFDLFSFYATSWGEGFSFVV